MNNPPLSKTIRTELINLPVILWIMALAIFYLFSIQLLLNYKLISASFSQYSLSSIISILFYLLIGSFTSLSAEPLPFFLLLLNAVFVGLNLVLLFKVIKGLNRGKVHVVLGGATIFSIVTAGCASCGLSLISVLGLSTTLAFLPFRGAELRVIALGLLIISAFYMLKKIHEAKYCRI